MKNLIRILTTCILIHLSYQVKSQCTPVCGTLTTKGTTTIVPSGTETVTPKAGSVFTVTPVSGSTFTTIVNNNVAVHGTVTANGTQTITPTGNYTITTTYSNVNAPGTNTITAGALSVSISNTGSDIALFNGTEVPPGLTINIQIPNTTLPAYTYDCQTSTLNVLVNR